MVTYCRHFLQLHASLPKLNGFKDDEVEIEDMTWDEQASVYHWPCPCGDRFEITRVNITRLGGAVQARYLVLVEARKADFSMFQPQLAEGYDVGQCPSCSLLIRIIFDQVCPKRGFPILPEFTADLHNRWTLRSTESTRIHLMTRRTSQRSSKSVAI